jgi:hypothetical protein
VVLPRSGQRPAGGGRRTCSNKNDKLLASVGCATNAPNTTPTSTTRNASLAPARIGTIGKEPGAKHDSSSQPFAAAAQQASFALFRRLQSALGAAPELH